MSGPLPDGRRFWRRRSSNPFRGGLTGIALVALATLALSIAGGVIAVLALLLAG